MYLIFLELLLNDALTVSGHIINLFCEVCLILCDVLITQLMYLFLLSYVNNFSSVAG